MFTLRPRLDQDVEAILAIRNPLASEPISADEMRKLFAAHTQACEVYEYWVAQDEDGALLGYGVLVKHEEMPPGRWQIRVTVDPAHRGKGVAAALYAHLEAIAREGLAVELESDVKSDDDAAFAWAEKHGFVSDRVRTESVLDLETFDSSRFAGVIEKAFGSGLRVEFHTPALPESDEYLKPMYDFHAETFPEIPAFVPPFPSYEVWVKMFRGETKADLPIFVVHAFDGEVMVGESTIGLPQLEGASAYTMYTAVRKAYRGRGLALALKLLTIQETQKHGIKRMRTNNDPDNPAMLAVNEKLGYVLVPGPRRILKKL